jgi:hypothetical protein
MNVVIYETKVVASSSNSLLSIRLPLSILGTCSSTARMVIATPNTASVKI